MLVVEKNKCNHLSSRRIELLTFGTGIRRATITPTAHETTIFLFLKLNIKYFDNQMQAALLIW